MTTTVWLTFDIFRLFVGIIRAPFAQLVCTRCRIGSIGDKSVSSRVRLFAVIRRRVPTAATTTTTTIENSSFVCSCTCSSCLTGLWCLLLSYLKRCGVVVVVVEGMP
jgi:hypothetical protein